MEIQLEPSLATASSQAGDSPETACSSHLLVVVLNYRTADLTIDCLRSIAAEVQTLPGVRVVVTDNNSGDDSVDKIQAALTAHDWQTWASLMPLDRNGGFAFGNNAAIRIALQSAHPPAYILLLNPDTVARPGALQALLEFMDGNPSVGIAGSRLEDPDGTSQRSAFRFHTALSELESGLRLGVFSKLLTRWIVAPPVPTEACQVDWVAGASMIIRRDVFATAGLMDEAYFMYYEEVDFCLQARKAGWNCWYVPQSRVVHLVGQSSGVTDRKRAPKRRPQYWFDSRRRYFVKNYGWLYAAIADIAWALGFALWRIRRVIQRKPDSDPPQFLQDFLWNSVFRRGFKVEPPKCL
jgi:hypothetical protein